MEWHGMAWNGMVWSVEWYMAKNGAKHHAMQRKGKTQTSTNKSNNAIKQ